jgi:hypothetical protein
MNTRARTERPTTVSGVVLDFFDVRGANALLKFPSGLRRLGSDEN